MQYRLGTRNGSTFPYFLKVWGARGPPASSVGRLLERPQGTGIGSGGSCLERDRAVTVFLPENAYVAEVVNCREDGQQFTVELVLIQYQDT